MLFTWLGIACNWWLRLFIPPPVDAVKAINPNAFCPSCGAKKGSIKFVIVTTGFNYVEHTCGVCAYRWPERTVQECK